MLLNKAQEFWTMNDCKAKKEKIDALTSIKNTMESDEIIIRTVDKANIKIISTSKFKK